MSLENIDESTVVERLRFIGRIKACLRESDHDLFIGLGDDIANIIAEKMLFLAALAPSPASFSPDSFERMTDLGPNQANRILEIARELGFIFPQEGTSRLVLGLAASRLLVSLCDP